MLLFDLSFTLLKGLQFLAHQGHLIAQILQLTQAPAVLLQRIPQGSEQPQCHQQGQQSQGAGRQPEPEAAQQQRRQAIGTVLEIGHGSSPSR